MDDAIRLKTSHTCEVCTIYRNEVLCLDVTFTDFPKLHLSLEISPRAYSKMLMQYLHHLVSNNFTEAAQIVANIVPVDAIQLDDAGIPKCPKCGVSMRGGAPHGPWAKQWECRPCGVYLKSIADVG
jgi:hypothetical protein